jgi:biotin-dependent carboxylase-like uncharacterized protein
MDWFALRAANLLVGNPPDAAALEFTRTGPTILARDKCVIALVGADIPLHVNDQPMPRGMSLFVRAGSVIAFGEMQRGAWAYLAVSGGIDVPRVIGSRSTYLRGGFGGFAGRALRAGDVISVVDLSGLGDLTGLAGAQLRDAAWDYSLCAGKIRVIRGLHYARFTDEAREVFTHAVFTVSETSDRMGYRLQGPKLARADSQEILSLGVPLGVIQVPTDGQPIILMADHQTTGGYPLIASVIRADLPRAAQRAPGETIEFEIVEVEEARRALVEAVKMLVCSAD